MQNNLDAVLEVMKFIYDHIIYAELNTKSDYCQVCGWDGEIEVVEEDGKLIWKCPQCGNTDQDKMNVARRTCGYIGTSSGTRVGRRRSRIAYCTCDFSNAGGLMPAPFSFFPLFQLNLIYFNLCGLYSPSGGRSMHYGELKNVILPTVSGVRVTLFVSGCTNHCPDCFQPQTWDFDYGKEFTGGDEGGDIRRAGQALCQRTDGAGRRAFRAAEPAGAAAAAAGNQGEVSRKTIWCFTGFRLDDELLADGSYPRCEATDELLACIDVLVDGRFMRELKDISCNSGVAGTSGSSI